MRVGTPLRSEVDNPSFRNCGSREWGARSSLILIGPIFEIHKRGLSGGGVERERERGEKRTYLREGRMIRLLRFQFVRNLAS